MLPAFLVAQFDSSVTTKPREGALHDIAHSPQSAAVGLARGGQHWNHLADGATHLVGQAAIGRIPHQLPGPETPPAAMQRGQAIEKRHGHGAIGHVRWRGAHDQRHTAAIGEDVTFTPFFGSIRGIRPGVRPPKTARTLALSMTPRERSNWPRCPKIFRSLACTLGQTP